MAVALDIVGLSAFGVFATALVTIGIVAAILLFERRRAQQIERNLDEEARRRRRHGPGGQ
jgi:hypothetical protein